MDTINYLRRINLSSKTVVNDDFLKKLHLNHVLNVPFENFDIHYQRPISLELECLYEKVVVNFRGGFCYELNYLFNALLCRLGYNSRIISARIYGEREEVGPEYDHMAIFVETDKKYLLDVGFGDLFIKPLEIRHGFQVEDDKIFKIESLANNEFLLSMSSDQSGFVKKYTFSLDQVGIDDFFDICLDKQTNPSSYFVKNTVCTLPNKFGRVTIFNDKLVIKKKGVKITNLITNQIQLSEILKLKFNIQF